MQVWLLYIMYYQNYVKYPSGPDCYVQRAGQVMGVSLTLRMAVDLPVTVYAVELSMDITCNHSLYFMNL